MNYTDFLIQKMERKTARELAQEYKYGQLLLKSRNIGDKMIGYSYISAISMILKPKDITFNMSFNNYRRVWNG